MYLKQRKKNSLRKLLWKTSPVCHAYGRSTTPYCKESDKPRNVEGSSLLRIVLGRTQIGPVTNIFVSVDLGFTCIENSGTDRIINCRNSMGTRKQRCQAIPAANKRNRIRYRRVRSRLCERRHNSKSEPTTNFRALHWRPIASQLPASSSNDPLPMRSGIAGLGIHELRRWMQNDTPPVGPWYENDNADPQDAGTQWNTAEGIRKVKK